MIEITRVTTITRIAIIARITRMTVLLIFIIISSLLHLITTFAINKILLYNMKKKKKSDKGIGKMEKETERIDDLQYKGLKIIQDPERILLWY